MSGLQAQIDKAATLIEALPYILGAVPNVSGSVLMLLECIGLQQENIYRNTRGVEGSTQRTAWCTTKALNPKDSLTLPLI